RGRALQDQAMAKEWEITADQLAKLKKINASGSRLQATPEQRQIIAALWDAYLKSSDGPSRIDSEKRIVDTLDNIAKGSQPASKKAALDAIDQIKQVLTPKQVERMSK